MAEHSAENDPRREAIARAIFESDFGHRHGQKWEEAGRASRQPYYRNADAVISVLPPGDEDDCTCGHDHGVSTTTCDRCYWCREAALRRVPSCAWHGHGAYPDSCWWCALNRVIPPGRTPRRGDGGDAL